MMVHLCSRRPCFVRVTLGTRPFINRFAYRPFTFFGSPSQMIQLQFINFLHALTPISFLILVWPLSLSLATTYEISFDYYSWCYLDVSVHTVPLIKLLSHLMMTAFFSAGFPHSDICGSLTACVFPQLFAACYVLLRLSVPSIPPIALYCFFILVKFISRYFTLTLLLPVFNLLDFFRCSPATFLF